MYNIIQILIHRTENHVLRLFKRYILWVKVKSQNSEVNVVPYLGDWTIRIDEVDILAAAQTGINLFGGLEKTEKYINNISR